jgi:hypothetical protein
MEHWEDLLRTQTTAVLFSRKVLMMYLSDKYFLLFVTWGNGEKINTGGQL